MTAQVLRALGFNFGSEDAMLPAVPNDNAKGYIERWDVVRLNTELYEKNGSEHPYGPFRYVDRWWLRGDMQGYRDRAAEILEDIRLHDPDNPVIALKDPRLSLTLPLWLSVARGDIYVVWANRSLNSVVDSLKARDQNVDREHMKQIAIEYNNRITQATNGLHFNQWCILYYNTMIAAPRTSLSKLLTDFGISVLDPRVEAAVREIDPDLRHHYREV